MSGECVGPELHTNSAADGRAHCRTRNDSYSLAQGNRVYVIHLRILSKKKISRVAENDLLNKLSWYFRSSLLTSAMNQVYQSVARLIRLCDDVLLHQEKALTKESAQEVVQCVQDAVQVKRGLFLHCSSSGTGPHPRNHCSRSSERLSRVSRTWFR